MQHANKGLVQELHKWAGIPSIHKNPICQVLPHRRKCSYMYVYDTKWKYLHLFSLLANLLKIVDIFLEKGREVMLLHYAHDSHKYILQKRDETPSFKHMQHLFTFISSISFGISHKHYVINMSFDSLLLSNIFQWIENVCHSMDESYRPVTVQIQVLVHLKYGCAQVDQRRPIVHVKWSV